MMRWTALIISLPTQNATARMRIWRALKQLGCGVPRDGVYLLPAGGSAKTALEEQAAEVREAQGSAYVAELSELNADDSANLVGLFDRTGEYADILDRSASLLRSLSSLSAVALRREIKRLQRDFDAIAAIDYFSGDARERAAAAVADVIASATRLLAPDEPHASDVTIEPVERAKFQGRIWATRKNIWIDRIASAWLIRRFIDRKARFLWLDNAGNCPRDALGFDFDGARFTHVGKRVTFEVLLASFTLNDSALDRIAAAIHYLDVGGVPTEDSAGLETVVRGAKQRFAGDDQLLEHASSILDDFYASYSNDI